MKRVASCLSVMIFLALTASILGCSKEKPKPNYLKEFPVTGLEEVLDEKLVTFDKNTSSDGNGSLKITAEKATTVSLYDAGDLDIEDAALEYSAKLKVEDLTGKVYLEMLCRVPGQGEFFSKGLHNPILKPTDWVEREIPFFFKKGENPDKVVLNLVIEGKGTVWIDDIKLSKGPLK